MKEGNKVAEDESDVVKSLNKRSDSLLQASPVSPDRGSAAC